MRLVIVLTRMGEKSVRAKMTMRRGRVREGQRERETHREADTDRNIKWEKIREEEWLIVCVPFGWTSCSNEKY